MQNRISDKPSQHTTVSTVHGTVHSAAQRDKAERTMNRTPCALSGSLDSKRRCYAREVASLLRCRTEIKTNTDIDQQAFGRSQPNNSFGSTNKQFLTPSSGKHKFNAYVTVSTRVTESHPKPSWNFINTMLIYLFTTTLPYYSANRL